ncbi:hypothetical protein Tco_1484607 [Tanacetum coccineum]
MSTHLGECSDGVNVCFSDCDDDEFPYMSAKQIDLEIGNKTVEMKEKLTSLSQDDLDMPWGMATPDTDDDASITNEVESELEDEIAVAKIFADLDEAYEEDVDSHLDEAFVLEEVEDLGMFDNLVDDDSIDEPNEVDLEAEDEVAVADIFAELEQAYEEDIDSYLGKALVLEELEDLGIFDNICAPMVYQEIGEREVDDQLFLGDPVDNEMTKHDAIENYCSNVPIGRPRKRKRVEYDETDSGYVHCGNR